MINIYSSARPSKGAFPITRLLFFLVATTVIISFLIWCLYLLDKDTMPITSVYIVGDIKYTNVSHLKSEVEKSIDAGLLYLNTRQIRNVLLAEPWIEDAYVRKVWPPGLSVKIIEKVPVAKWGAPALLSSSGAVFEPRELEGVNNLVTLFSLRDSPKNVIENFLVVKEVFEHCGVLIKHFGATDRGEWLVLTTDGKRINLGRGDIREKLSRFQFAYERDINAYWPSVTRIDLRYSNGLTVNKRQIKEMRGTL